MEMMASSVVTVGSTMSGTSEVCLISSSSDDSFGIKSSTRGVQLKSS